MGEPKIGMENWDGSWIFAWHFKEFPHGLINFNYAILLYNPPEIINLLMLYMLTHLGNTATLQLYSEFLFNMLQYSDACYFCCSFHVLNKMCHLSE